MDQSSQRVVLITGASSGIGRACATRFHQKGYRVYGTSRKPEPSSFPFELIRMDLDQDDSVQDGVNLILEKSGHLDVVVNNGGFTLAGAVEDTSIQEAKAQFETNFFGALRVTGAVLPGMREQRSGYIVNISSIAALIALPFQGLYSASKSALEGMTEALRVEVKPFGIHIALVEPGDCCTQVAAYRRWASASHTNSTYRDRATRALAVMEADERKGSPPDKVARVVERIVTTRSPRLRYVVGSPFERSVAVLKRMIPSRLAEWLLMKYYKLL